jgi:hypothetical protein
LCGGVLFSKNDLCGEFFPLKPGAPLITSLGFGVLE